MEPADKSIEKLTFSILDCAKLLGIGRSAAYEAVRRGSNVLKWKLSAKKKSFWSRKIQGLPSYGT